MLQGKRLKEGNSLPQVCKILGYLIFFWSREDSEPPHVHV
ncbi:MAG: DUF4160 domain-containing protein, partial [Selenomonadaceae bacterium]|nr:DUF4160 domain-containing protein [Selenomonadaceae bacterium]